MLTPHKGQVIPASVNAVNMVVPAAGSRLPDRELEIPLANAGNGLRVVTAEIMQQHTPPGGDKPLPTTDNANPFNKLRNNVPVLGPPKIKSPADFHAETAAAERAEIERLKYHVLYANHLAKAATGRLRAACYQTKNDALGALLKRGAATVNSIDSSSWDEAVVGISFPGGGRVHTRPSLLDPDAQQIVHRQLAKHPMLGVSR